MIPKPVVHKSKSLNKTNRWRRALADSCGKASRNYQGMSNRDVFRMTSQTSNVSSLLVTWAIRGNRRCGTTGVRKDFKNRSSNSPKASVTILSVNGIVPSFEEGLNRNGNLESSGEVGDLTGNWSKGKSWPSSRH